MRIPLGAGAWLDYDPEWLPSEEADHALTGLRGELSWEQREIVLFGRRVLQPRRKQDRDRHELSLGHGALLVMGGTCQRHYVHGIPRQAGIHGERISLTFRYLLRDP